MLYPIELLGHSCQHQNGCQRDGVHVNGTGHFCHVVFGCHGCGPYPFKTWGLTAIMHFALHLKAIIAKRMQARCRHALKLLIYKDFYPIRSWHAVCTTLSSKDPS